MTQSIYEIEFNIKIFKQTYDISKTHKNCCQFKRKYIHDFMIKSYKLLHIGFIQVVVKPLTKKCINASVVLYLRDVDSKKFKQIYL